jgi:hypothetical protein
MHRVANGYRVKLGKGDFLGHPGIIGIVVIITTTMILTRRSIDI